MIIIIKGYLYLCPWLYKSQGRTRMPCLLRGHCCWLLSMIVFVVGLCMYK